MSIKGCNSCNWIIFEVYWKIYENLIVLDVIVFFAKCFSPNFGEKDVSNTKTSPILKLGMNLISLKR